MTSTQLTRPIVRTRARTRPARATRARPEVLWTRADRVVTAVLIAAGVAVIGLAWVGASGTTDWDTQMSWTALAMVGVVLVGAGVGVWLFRGLARVRVEARLIRRQVGARIVRATPPAGADLVAGRGRVTVAGMAHHHRADCLLVRGKNVVAADETALAPCGVCA